MIQIIPISIVFLIILTIVCSVIMNKIAPGSFLPYMLYGICITALYAFFVCKVFGIF